MAQLYQSRPQDALPHLDAAARAAGERRHWSVRPGRMPHHAREKWSTPRRFSGRYGRRSTHRNGGCFGAGSRSRAAFSTAPSRRFGRRRRQILIIANPASASDKRLQRLGRDEAAYAPAGLGESYRGTAQDRPPCAPASPPRRRPPYRFQTFRATRKVVRVPGCSPVASLVRARGSNSTPAATRVGPAQRRFRAAARSLHRLDSPATRVDDSHDRASRSGWCDLLAVGRPNHCGSGCTVPVVRGWGGGRRDPPTTTSGAP